MSTATTTQDALVRQLIVGLDVSPRWTTADLFEHVRAAARARGVPAEALPDDVIRGVSARWFSEYTLACALRELGDD